MDILLDFRKRVEREREINVKKKHQSVASYIDSNWVSNPQPRYMLWAQIKPTTFLVYGMKLKTTELPSQDSKHSKESKS